MRLQDFYNQYKTQKECILHLENILWGDEAICPYCNSKYNTDLKTGVRKHCNTCNTSFSVTVSSLFHKTKVDLQKWFYTIYLIKNGENLTSRSLAEIISVNKDTANKMINSISYEMVNNPTFIQLV